jgi:hypothetical protein
MVVVSTWRNHMNKGIRQRRREDRERVTLQGQSEMSFCKDDLVKADATSGQGEGEMTSGNKELTLSEFTVVIKTAAENVGEGVDRGDLDFLRMTLA